MTIKLSIESETSVAGKADVYAAMIMAYLSGLNESSYDCHSSTLNRMDRLGQQNDSEIAKEILSRRPDYVIMVRTGCEFTCSNFNAIGLKHDGDLWPGYSVFSKLQQSVKTIGVSIPFSKIDVRKIRRKALLIRKAVERFRVCKCRYCQEVPVISECSDGTWEATCECKTANAFSGPTERSTIVRWNAMVEGSVSGEEISLAIDKGIETVEGKKEQELLELLIRAERGM